MGQAHPRTQRCLGTRARCHSAVGVDTEMTGEDVGRSGENNVYFGTQATKWVCRDGVEANKRPLLRPPLEIDSDLPHRVCSLRALPGAAGPYAGFHLADSA